MHAHGLNAARLLVVGIVAPMFLLMFAGACSSKNGSPAPDAAQDHARAKPEPETKPEPVAVIVDVRELAGKSQAHVTGVVGSEPSCAPDKVPGHGEGTRCKWAEPSIDALFYEDKLRRAEISGGKLRFEPQSGAAYGLDSNPTLKNDNVIKWKFDGFEASMFSDGARGVDYFYLSDGS